VQTVAACCKARFRLLAKSRVPIRLRVASVTCPTSHPAKPQRRRPCPSHTPTRLRTAEGRFPQGRVGSRSRLLEGAHRTCWSRSGIPMVLLQVGVRHRGSWRCRSSWSGRRLADSATAAFVGGQGSRLAAGRTPLVGTGVPAASGSRSWCRQRVHTARRQRLPPGEWPSRRRAAPRTATTAPRSAGPGPGHAKSPPSQAIELMFGRDRESY
jgi:hypothetical protein